MCGLFGVLFVSHMHYGNMCLQWPAPAPLPLYKLISNLDRSWCSSDQSGHRLINLRKASAMAVNQSCGKWATLLNYRAI